MLRIQLNKFLLLLIIFISLVSALVLNNKARFDAVKMTAPTGDVKLIKLPYSSKIEGQSGVYRYKVDFQNSFFFSGLIQIIPDDCVEQILVNGQPILGTNMLNGKCDYTNGFYLNINEYIKRGTNILYFDVRNDQGVFGLNIIDKSFYEKYILFSVIIFLLVFVKFDLLADYVFEIVKKIFSSKSWGIFTAVGVWALLVFFYILFPKNEYKVTLLSVLMLFPVVLPACYLIFKGSVYKNILYVFLLSITLWLLFLANIPYSEYGYDAAGHVRYIEYVFANKEAPIDTGGWVFYHPSFYYRCCALILNTFDPRHVLNNNEMLKIVQVFSLDMFIVYCFFSIKTLDFIFRRLISEKKLETYEYKIGYFLTIGLFLFWSSNGITSIRVGNDMMFYLFYAITFYLVVVWWYSGRLLYFFGALVFVSIDIWAKSNGFILLAVICILFAIRFFQNPMIEIRNPRFLTKLYLLIICLLAVSYFFLNQKIAKLKNDPQAKMIVGNTDGLSDKLKVGNGIKNFSAFNSVKFVKIPFTSAFDPEKGREFFWFYLFKTSLFGEFSFNKGIMPFLAKALSLLFLGLLLFSLSGLINGFKDWRKAYFPVIVGVGMLVLSMVVFRHSYPFSCSNDFRYIFPAVLPFCLFSGAGLLYFYRNKYLFFSCAGVFVLFIVFSLVFQFLIAI